MDIRSVKGKGRHSDSPVAPAENRGGISAATGSDITVTTFPLQCKQDKISFIFQSYLQQKTLADG